MTISTKSGRKSSRSAKAASTVTGRTRETPFYAQDSDRGETEVAPLDLSTDLESGDIEAASPKAGPQMEDYYSVEKVGGANGGKLFTLNGVARRGAPPKDDTKAGPEDFKPNAVLVKDGPPVAAPNIEWRGPVPNQSGGRAGHTPIAICDHIMAGTLASTDGWFKNSKAGVSAHFGVGRKGEIYQWVSVDDMAWANGLGYDANGKPYVTDPKGNIIYEKPDKSVPWIKTAVEQRVNPNYLTISIEHDGQTGQAFTEEEYQATRQLHHFLIQKYNIPPLRDHFVGHFQISSVNRAFCPGKAFQWDRLMQDLVSVGTPLVQVSYMAAVHTVAIVRPGPGTSFTPGVKKQPGADKKFQVIGEAKGEPIWDARRNRTDDTWAFFTDLDGVSGFVTRTALDWE